MATKRITTDELIEARMDETGLTREQLCSSLPRAHSCVTSPPAPTRTGSC